MADFLHTFWPHLLAITTAILSVVASAHAVLNKRDSRSATMWVGLIWLAPILGTLLYVLLGINRIRREARSKPRSRIATQVQTARHVCTHDQVVATLPAEVRHLASLSHMMGQVTGRPLMSGNRVEPLIGGEQAYPAMLQAIDAAEKSITLASYIFNSDATGASFVAALERALRRGVEVRVLIDAIGSRYKWPTILPRLREAGIRAAKFLPTTAPIYMPYANLRNHRKLLVLDGSVGFTGGMNIRDFAGEGPDHRHAIHDMHFHVMGPVVDHFQHAFADDWEFATGEQLLGQAWFAPPEAAGAVLARGVTDGPDQDLGKLRAAILGAITCAEQRVRVVTPYFLPDEAIMSALGVAAMRGIEVDILLPEENNQKLVQWASMSQIGPLLASGCRLWYVPPPFDHSKLMLVDGCWVLFGSGNWDARSLRLNFEFNVEAYDAPLAARLNAYFDSQRARSRPITLDEVNGRSLLVKLRDGVARLFSPII